MKCPRCGLQSVMLDWNSVLQKKALICYLCSRVVVDNQEPMPYTKLERDERHSETCPQAIK